jgi:hypothetical protein
VSNILEINKRPLPSFKEWIEEHSPGTQADGFEALTDLVRRSVAGTDFKPGLTDQEKSFSRMWIGFCIACVELCNMEALTHERPESEIIVMLPRVIATGAMYAIASSLQDEAPFRDIAKIVTEEFRAAAKVAADQLSEPAK